MKKLHSIGVALVLALAIACAGCGGDSQSADGRGNQSKVGGATAGGDPPSVIDSTTQAINSSVEKQFALCLKTAANSGDDDKKKMALVRCESVHQRALEGAKRRIEMLKGTKQRCITQANGAATAEIKKQLLKRCESAPE